MYAKVHIYHVFYTCFKFGQLFTHTRMILRASNRLTRSSNRLTRSSTHSAKQFEFSQVIRSQKRISSQRRKPFLLLAAKRTAQKKHEVSHLRWKKSLRLRATPRIKNARPCVKSKHAADESFRGHSKVTSSSEWWQECSICAERKGKYVTPALVVRFKAEWEKRRQFPDPVTAILECGHGTGICKSCTLRFITDSLEREGQWDRVTCIECKQFLSKDQLAKLLRRGDIKRFRLPMLEHISYYERC